MDGWMVTGMKEKEKRLYLCRRKKKEKERGGDRPKEKKTKREILLKAGENGGTGRYTQIRGACAGA